MQGGISDRARKTQLDCKIDVSNWSVSACAASNVLAALGHSDKDVLEREAAETMVNLCCPLAENLRHGKETSDQKSSCLPSSGSRATEGEVLEEKTVPSATFAEDHDRHSQGGGDDHDSAEQNGGNSGDDGCSDVCDVLKMSASWAQPENEQFDAENMRIDRSDGQRGRNLPLRKTNIRQKVAQNRELSSVVSSQECKKKKMPKKNRCNNIKVRPRSRDTMTGKAQNEEDLCCDICGKLMQNLSAILSHLKTHGGMAKTSRFKPKVHKKDQVCEVCGRAFRKPYELKKHVAAHEWEESRLRKKKERLLMVIKCEICNKEFKHVTNLKRHNLIHTGEKPFKCATCNKAFRQQSAVLSHMLSHTGVKPYKCDLCTRGFISASGLAYHKGSHEGTNIAKYQCQFCGKGFTRKHNLHYHEKNHTGDTENFVGGGDGLGEASPVTSEGLKPSQPCLTCGKAFMHREGLKRHIKSVHEGPSGLICGWCGRVFRHRCNLQEHINGVHMEKYKCVTCGRLFGSSYNLKVHHRTHTGEKPYICRDCGKAFADICNMRAHQKRYHEQGLHKPGITRLTDQQPALVNSQQQVQVQPSHPHVEVPLADEGRDCSLGFGCGTSSRSDIVHSQPARCIVDDLLPMASETSYPPGGYTWLSYS